MRRGCWCGALVEGAGTVDTHRDGVVAFALFICVGGVVGGHVPFATHKVVNVVAQFLGSGTFAGTDAELGVGHEVGPFVVLHGVAERVAVQQSTNGVTFTVRSTVIKFTSLITLVDVNLGKVTYAGDLDIVGCLDEMNALEGTVGDNAGSTSGFGAPCYFVLFSVTDVTGRRRSPEAEVLCGVDPRSLAH